MLQASIPRLLAHHTDMPMRITRQSDRRLRDERLVPTGQKPAPIEPVHVSRQVMALASDRTGAVVRDVAALEALACSDGHLPQLGIVLPELVAALAASAAELHGLDLRMAGIVELSHDPDHAVIYGHLAHGAPAAFSFGQAAQPPARIFSVNFDQLRDLAVALLPAALAA